MGEFGNAGIIAELGRKKHFILLKNQFPQTLQYGSLMSQNPKES